MLRCIGGRQCRGAQVLPGGLLAGESCFVARERKGSSRILSKTSFVFIVAQMTSRRGPELFTEWDRIRKQVL